MSEQDVTERATSMGWTPKEEFRGKPENWRTAEEFVQMAESSMPHLKGTLKTLEASNADLKARIASMQSDFSEFIQMSRTAEERAYQRALQDLERKKVAAKEAGDMPAYVQAAEEIESKLKEHPALTGKVPEQPKLQPQGQPANNDLETWLNAEPGIEEGWKADNPLIYSDPELYDYAERMDRFLSARDGLSKPRSYRLQEISRLVKEKFPEKFGNPARKAASAVEGDSGGKPSSGNGQSYNDLPPEAQAQCDKWTGKDGKGEKGTIRGLTREDYLKQYKWDKTYTVK